MPLWLSLESLPGPAATAAGWASCLGDRFGELREAFFQRTPALAGSYPCPRGCGCAHEVYQPSATEVVAVCRCESWCCEDLTLKPEDIVVWEPSWARLGQALCAALNLRPTRLELGLHGTRQIGAWGGQAVPVILAVQHTRSRFREVLTALVARIRAPFILLAPTARHLDARGAESLSGVGAGFFSLETQVRVGPSGALHPVAPPGELFARFTASPAETTGEAVASRAFALVRQLDSERPLRPPSLLTVFRLYCIEELSAARIARRCGTSKATVIRRLELLRARTGLKPQNLRRFSSHLDRYDETLCDSRAAHIHRRRLIYDDAEEEE